MEFLKELDFDWKVVVYIILIIIGAAILSRLVRWLINRSFATASEKLKIDPTQYKFFKNAASLAIWILAFAAIILMIPRLKALAITLLAGAGILVAITGFAAQEAFSNIIGGIFIIIFKPFRVVDLIQVGSLDYGAVEDNTLRHIIINNFQNKRIIIPNSVINSTVIVNDSIHDSRVCRWIDVGISCDSDIELATRIMQEEVIKHPECIDVRTPKQKEEGKPQVVARVNGFIDFSVNLRAFVWTADSMSAFQMHSDINKSIKKRFYAEGVEIPFPYRTLVYKKDLTPNTKLNANE